MIDKQITIALISIIVITAFIFIGIAINSSKMDSISQDLNVLKSDDNQFASYIIQNSQTLDYLNKNCKVTSDNNETTTLVCIKVKQ